MHKKFIRLEMNILDTCRKNEIDKLKWVKSNNILDDNKLKNMMQLVY